MHSWRERDWTILFGAQAAGCRVLAGPDGVVVLALHLEGVCEISIGFRFRVLARMSHSRLGLGLGSDKNSQQIGFKFTIEALRPS